MAIEAEKIEQTKLNDSIDAMRLQMDEQAAALDQRRQVMERKEEEVNELFKLGDERMEEAEKLKREYGGHEQEIANVRTKLNEQTDLSLRRFEEIEQLRSEIAKLSLGFNERSGLAEIAKTELESSRDQ